jgi:hypothetical protein
VWQRDRSDDGVKQAKTVRVRRSRAALADLLRVSRIDRFQVVDRLCQSEVLERKRTSARSQPRGERAIGQQTNDGISEGRWIVWRDKQAGLFVANAIHEAADGRRDERQARNRIEIVILVAQLHRLAL